MFTTYINTFPINNRPAGSDYVATNEVPVEYKGLKIYHRIKSTKPGGNVYDVVRDGKCIGMYSGMSGAKCLIDTLLSTL